MQTVTKTSASRLLAVYSPFGGSDDSRYINQNKQATNNTTKTRFRRNRSTAIIVDVCVTWPGLECCPFSCIWRLGFSSFTFHNEALLFLAGHWCREIADLRYDSHTAWASRTTVSVLTCVTIMPKLNRGWPPCNAAAWNIAIIKELRKKRTTRARRWFTVHRNIIVNDPCRKGFDVLRPVNREESYTYQLARRNKLTVLIH